MGTQRVAGLLALVTVSTLLACRDTQAPFGELELKQQSVGVTPSPLVTAAGHTFWAYTGNNFSGLPKDPINLVFTGIVDPRNLRAVLVGLSGDRSMFASHPLLAPVAGFTCTWKDAIGEVQTAYDAVKDWVGSAIQLECGDYGPLRFHLRFFSLGDVTIGGAHVDMLIPGTTDHQVVSWEFAEVLVLADFIRSGFLGAAPGSTGSINDAPWREIPGFLFSMMPADLQALVIGSGGVVLPSGNVAIGTDGAATVLSVAADADMLPEVARQEFVINFNQVIPKPFCASGPYDYLLAQGPITLRQQIVVTPAGNYLSQFHAVGHLDLTPVNPTTSPPTPIGETFRAVVNEHHKGVMTDRTTLAAQFMLQVMIPPGGPFRGSLNLNLNVGPGGADHASLAVKCDP